MMSATAKETSSRRELGLGILLAVIAGVLDALAVHSKFFTTDRIDYIPTRIWIVSPLVWVFYALVMFSVLKTLPVRRILIPLFVAGIAGTLVTVRTIILFRMIRPESGITLSVPLALLLTGAIGYAALRVRQKLARIHLLRRRAILLGAVLLTLTAIAMASFSATPQPQRSGGAASETLPNVVLIFLDTLRYDSSGLAPGAATQAPNLAGFASSGVVFDNAYAHFSWTLPSHFSTITGYGPATLELDFDRQRYNHQRPTLAEVFRNRGYRTGAILSNPYINPGTGFARGYDTFRYPVSDLDLCRTSLGFLLKLIPNARVPICRLTAAQVTGGALRFIDRSPQPFFLTLNYMEPHLPYYVPRGFRPPGYKRFDPFSEYPRIDRAMKQDLPLPDESLEQMRANYAVAIRYLDASLAPLFAKLSSSPLHEKTIVVIVSDHGEQFGEHNLSLHGNSVYRQVLRVPLAIRAPGLSAGRISAPVSLQGIYGTLLEQSGMNPRSLVTLPLKNPSTPQPVLGLYRAPRGFRGVPPRLAEDAWSVVIGNHHFIRYALGREELYDWTVDPHEEREISRETTSAAVLDRARAVLDDVSRSRQRTLGEEQRRRFFSLGYMQ